MPVIPTDANSGKLNVLIPMLVAPGMEYHAYSVVDVSTTYGVVRISNRTRAMFAQFLGAPSLLLAMVLRAVLAHLNAKES